MNFIKRVRDKLGRVAFSTAGSIGSCKTEDTIVIAGSPRSGTTLLLEALHKAKGYKAINEPLLTPRSQKKYGFDSRSYIPIDKKADHQRFFLNQVLQGQMDSSARWVFEAQSKSGKLLEHASRKKVIVKFCRITRMLPWFADQFNARGVVLIIRHPCAVVNSMLRYGQWDMWTAEFVHKNKHNKSNALYIDHLPDSVRHVFEPVRDQISTQTEALAFMWCLDHYLPLIHAKKHTWIIVSYEKLILQNYNELKRITSILDLELNEEMLNVFNKPSSSVKGQIKNSAADQISKWQQQLTSRQIDNILSIVKTVNMSPIYSDKAEPDYSILNTLQSPDCRW